MIDYKDEGLDLIVYTEHLEEDVLNQMKTAMSADFVVRGALMPDAHLGYSLPIGGVVATDGVIVPAWVGYDIGCGMCAVQLDVSGAAIRANSQAIFVGIYDSVPVGFAKHTKGQALYYDFYDNLTNLGKDVFKKRNGSMQLGTLGGGNHFIEVGEGRDGKAWIIVHSGSRGFGHGLATEYMKLASPTGKATEGNFGFVADSENGRAYINDMNVALEYALANRKHMVSAVQRVIADILDKEVSTRWFINRNHNHAELRDGMWIHRKGATHAENGMMGVIPGNMRDGSFIVEGNGSEDALWSSSHGAGRVLGRKKAKETLDVAEFESVMVGITAKVGESTLDESPMAYKDIFEVMNNQKDLVTVIDHVVPIINVKG